MNHHCRFYEQYCWVLKRNIIFEETVFYTGERMLKCSHYRECAKKNGCENAILRGNLTMDAE